ncbi:tryptophan-rich sensory protein [Candidatus Pacearchaeota archaeon]|nr:tryptophan-rich sensory protein [Candidatus Pacearchaeota archaeon]
MHGKKSVRKTNRVMIFVIIFVIVYAAGFFGSIFTSGNVNSEWYLTNKPSLTPPNYVFPIVWNILYFLITLSLYFAWIKGNKKEKKNIAILFGINLAANAFWSPLFFALQSPLAAFVALLIILGTVIGIIGYVYKISKISSYLLIPYLAWVIFAGVLNAAFL